MTMNPYQGYSIDLSPALEGTAGFLLVFLVIFYLIVLAVGITFYVIESLGMYTIAKRRGIHHPWLAWIPVGNMWLLGSISDQYQYLAKGNVRNRRKVLLAMPIAMLGVYILMIAFGVVSAFGGSDMLSGALLALQVLGWIAVVVLAVITAVFQYIAYYDLFASCDPGNAVLYLVLSIVFGVTMPFFIFSCRKKDLGMPHREPVQPVQPVQPVFQPTAAPEAEPVAEPAPAAEEAADLPKTEE